MAKSLCHLLMYLNQALVAIFNVANINSKIFAGFLFLKKLLVSEVSSNLLKMKPSPNGQITLSFTDVRKSSPSRHFLR